MKATKYLKVSIPCKTYIKKYITTLYGHPVQATIKHSLGCMINLCLDKNIYLDNRISESFIHKYYNDELIVHVNKWQFQRAGFSVSPGKAHLINKFMEDLFEVHLFQFVDAGVCSGRERKSCIDQFATLHHIETEIDITFDALKKIEYRTRKKEVQKLDITHSALKNKEYRMRNDVDQRRDLTGYQLNLFQ